MAKMVVEAVINKETSEVAMKTEVVVMACKEEDSVAVVVDVETSMAEEEDIKVTSSHAAECNQEWVDKEVIKIEVAEVEEACITTIKVVVAAEEEATTLAAKAVRTSRAVSKGTTTTKPSNASSSTGEEIVLTATSAHSPMELPSYR